MKHHVKRLIEKPILAGIVSSVLVITYCGLIALFFFMAENIFPTAGGPNFALISFMLVLFVLSAAVCGILVFGLPIYFLIQKEIKKAGQYMVANLVAIVFFLIVIANLILLAQVISS